MARVLVAVSCALLLSGCSESLSMTESPPSLPTPSSAVPTATPTPERETPEEFVRRWVEVSNRMQNSGATAQYRSMSVGCRACAAVADQIEEYFRAGGYVKTKGWSIEEIQLSRPGHEGRITATVGITSAPTEMRASADSPVEHLGGGSVIQLLTLEPHEQSWLIVDVEQQAQ